jgi:plastocyanin
MNDAVEPRVFRPAVARGTPARIAAVLIGAAVAAGCGTKSPDEPSGPPAVATITITAGGANPRNVQITPGSRVRFVNNDTIAHNMTSDPHPEHNDCPEINQVGLLAPGQTRETGNFILMRTCGFHDHDLPDVVALRGQIVIRQ